MAAYGSSYGHYDSVGQPGGAGKNFASSYFNAAAAASAIPPGYAYFYGQPAVQNLAQGAYGYNPAAATMSVPPTDTLGCILMLLSQFLCWY